MAVSRKVLVQLGALGDILNILPIAYEQNMRGNRLTILTAEKYSPLLDGITYADRLVFKGEYHEIERAVETVKNQGLSPIVAQVYDKKYIRKTESFLRDSYARVGYEHRFEQLSLIFSRRNKEREAALVAQVDFTKPVVLMSLSGFSCPFKKGPELLAHVRAALPDFNVVDFDTLRAVRFYDLLGVMDRAHCLVTVDTGTLHLAKASSVPVVALVNTDPWVSSTRSANHLIRRTYKEVDPEEIVAAIRLTTKRAKRLVHVWADWKMSEPDRTRHLAARKTWEREWATGPWQECRVDTDEELHRNAHTEIGDLRPVPFVKDLLAAGLRATRHDSDIVVFTNSDIGFTPGAAERINLVTSAKGSAFSYRFDLSPEDVAAGKTTYLDVVSGAWCGGVDLFAFTRKWLKANLAKLPDMVLGRRQWDTVFRDYVKKTGGGEVYGSIYHEGHQSFWQEQPTTAGNVLNTRLADEYYTKHDSTRPFRYDYQG